MIENAIGTFQLPLGIAQNFLINGREVLVPMAIEEPSVLLGHPSWQNWRAPGVVSQPLPTHRR